VYFKMPSDGPREALQVQLGGFLDLCERRLAPAAPAAHPQSNLREVVDEAWAGESDFNMPEDAAQASFRGMDPGAAQGSGTITVGKYTGYTFEQLWEEDRSGAMWIISKAEEGDCGKNFAMFADWAKATHPQGVVAPDLFVTFGKHRGRSYQEVLEDDPDYCEWIVQKARTEASSPEGVGPNLQKWADWLMKNGVGR